jgi:myo-inositol 2-dehydrogenase/D-chiro-inositol 1-dehydrogenase
MGTERARAARALGADVMLLADTERGRAESLASEFPAARVVRPADVLEDGAIDAVFVCTPPAGRGPYELAAVRAGVPFFVEKPIGLSAHHVHGVLEALRASPVLSGVGYMNRHRPGLQTLRETLAGHEIFAVACHWVVAPYLKSWWTDPNVSGSPFNEQGTHLVDVCRYIVGEITHVSALGNTAMGRPQVADCVAVALRFAAGAHGTLLHSYRAPEKYISVRFFTSDGDFALDGWDLHLQGEDAESAHSRESEETPIFLTETHSFIEAIRHGGADRVLCTFEDAYRTQLVVDAIQCSLARGNAVPVDE